MSSQAPSSRSAMNAWLVDEMYDQFHEDPSSLSKSWQDFFADYKPDGTGGAPPATRAKQVKPPAKRDLPSGKAASTDAAEDTDETPKRLRGVGAKIVENMEASLGVPTATSVRDVPAKLLEVNRRILNNYLTRQRGGKVSFTHLIAYALVKGLEEVPAMKKRYGMVDGKPGVIESDRIGFGLAVDMPAKDGGRSLLVAVIKDAQDHGFAEFHSAYEELIRKIRTNKLTPDMFAGATMTLTNPGGIGTVLSVPRLMPGQSAIIGVGRIGYAAEYEAADPKMIANLGLSKTVTITSTYDHRVIQGAESGQFLSYVHELLIGKHGFYDEVFQALGIPYEPARWRTDATSLDSAEAMMTKQLKVHQLANMYRVRGHLIADLDPLRQLEPAMHPELDPVFYGLSIWDLDREFMTDGPNGLEKLQLGKILSRLRDAYCRTLSIEYMHIMDPAQKGWIQAHVEGVDSTLPPDEQQWILERLNAAEAFESFLHTKYVGQKRFGLEGGESLIPLVSAIIDEAADDGSINDVLVGMAHRGRLNVLANIMQKSPGQIFKEFEGDIDPDTVQGSGDVKYHLGSSTTWTSRAGNDVKLGMSPNPSHLETVNPVVEGRARALEDRYDVHATTGKFPALPVLLHGDAAFAGQGVVAETLNLSELRGYRTGGTIHVVINNQVGFTTSASEARSSFYCTDIAKMIGAPIIHVNGDDPEACVRAARLAFEFRQEFSRDVVIDMVCYRRHGHNEADDPSFTQPRMYELIENRRSVRKLYTEQLVKRGDISIDQAEQFLQGFEELLQEAFSETKQAKPPEPPTAIAPVEHGVLPHVITGVSRAMLDAVATTQYAVPEGFTRHPKLDRIFKRAEKRYAEGIIDWSMGETLAYGTLLLEGHHVRIAGQDSRRGTFSHRHAAQVDYVTGEDHLPLQHLADDQGKFMIYDSLLSEYAALGFEYGYAVESPETLVAWEAQFGDFVNGAQIIIDQYIVAAEDKWNLTAGLVMLLPHGYEGQGPEHSSARIERFLTLCAEDNIQVVNVTNAAQYFHVLRRQMHRDERKPLVIFTPKSLLRSTDAMSPIDDFTGGSFQETVEDPKWSVAGADREAIETVVFCSGKVAYDLIGARDERDKKAAIVRVEQLYPWPGEQILEVLRRYPNAKDVCWAQEEPINMGPWPFVDGRIWNILDELGDGRKLRKAARVASASPATGSHVVHSQELAQLLGEVFDPLS